MIIPNTDINLATEVGLALNGSGGNVTNDVTTFFKPQANIRMFAQNKPFIYPADFLEGLSIANTQRAGLSTVENKRGIFTYYTYKYNLPSGTSAQPMRLGDFKGYNSEAKAELTKTYQGYVDLDPDTNGYIGASESEATVNVTVTFPDLNPTYCPAGVFNTGTMQIVEYQGTNLVPLYTWDFNGVESLNWDQYKNATQNVQLKRSYNLPSSGEYSYPFTLYLMINGVEVSECPNNLIYRQWLQNINDESQWVPANITEEGTLVSAPNDYLYYSGLDYLKAKASTDITAMRIKNFCVPGVATEWTMHIDGRNNDSTEWVNLFSLTSSDFNQQNLSGGTFNGTTKLAMSYDDYTHNINGSNATVKCLNLMLKITNSNITDKQCTNYRIRLSEDVS